jgi:hypothetical protein
MHRCRAPRRVPANRGIASQRRRHGCRTDEAVCDLESSLNFPLTAHPLFPLCPLSLSLSFFLFLYDRMRGSRIQGTRHEGTRAHTGTARPLRSSCQTALSYRAQSRRDVRRCRRFVQGGRYEFAGRLTDIRISILITIARDAIFRHDGVAL